MLSLQALNSAAALATSLDNRNLIVRPIAGTNLYKLCEVSSTNDDHVWGDPGQRKIMIENVVSDTNRQDLVTGMCQHDVEMGELVEVVSDAITKHLSYARTVVAPAIDDLVQRTGSSIEQVMRSDMNQLEVVVWRMPAPMYNDSLVDSFRRATDVKPQELRAGAHLPTDATETQIVEWMKSGVVSLDESIDQYVSTLEAGELSNIFRQLFTVKSDYADLWKMFNDVESGVDTALVGFLISRKLWDNPPEGTETSLQMYEDEMVTIRNQCAVRLGYELDRVDRDEKHGILIRSFTRTSVEVNDSVYRKWLKDGGDHSVLFGNVMSYRPALTAEEISKNADKCKQAWESYCMVQKTTEANKKFSMAKQIIAVEFAAMVQSADETVLPIQDREIARKRFDAALQITKECEVQDLYSWSMRLMCDSWFYKTDAFQILDGINRVKAHSPEVDVKEAAAVAALEYIAYWVSTQFTVDSAIR
jgi:hypothetical protein